MRAISLSPLRTTTVAFLNTPLGRNIRSTLWLASPREVHPLRHHAAYTVAVLHLRHGRGVLLIAGISRRRVPCLEALVAHVVDQVMHMQHIAAGKNAGHAGLQLIVHRRRRRSAETSPHPRPRTARSPGSGPRTAKACRSQSESPCPGIGWRLRVHLRHRHARQTLLALNVNDRVAQIQGNVIVVQALYDVPVQAGGDRASAPHRPAPSRPVGSCAGP